MKISKKHLLAGLMSLSLAFTLVMPAVVCAGGTPPDVPSMAIFQGQQGGVDLGTATLTDLIASFIKIFMSFLGVIAVLIILYGGFIWMTASGEPEKVEKAKKLIYAGIIGLVIILISYAIANFVITTITGITGTTATGVGL